jgi:hypothetical protein
MRPASFVVRLSRCGTARRAQNARGEFDMRACAAAREQQRERGEREAECGCGQ